MTLIQGLLLVPLYLSYIPVKIYGAWLASGNILAWISAIDPGLTIVLQQQTSTFYGAGKLKKVGKLIGSGFIISCLILIITLSLGLISSYFIINLLNLSLDVDNSLILKAFKYAFFGTSLMLFSYSFQAINYGLQGSFSIGLINNMTVLLSIFFTILLLYSGYGLMSIAYSLVFNGLMLSSGNIFYTLYRVKNERINISFSSKNFIYLSKLLSYTFFSRASGVISNNIDLIFVSRFLGPEIVTSYALSKKPIALSQEFINQPVVAFQPIISHMYGSSKINKLRKLLSRLIIILIWISVFIIGGMISFNSEFVSLWVGESLFVGSNLNLIICLGAIIMIFTQSAGYFSVSLGDIKRNSVFSALQALLYIPLIYFGLKYFGLYGLVFAHIISMIITTTWYHPISVQRLIKLSSYDLKNIFIQTLFSLIIGIPLMTLFSFVDIDSWFEFLIYVILFSIIYFSFLFMISKMFRSECINTIKLISKKFNLFKKYQYDR